MEHKAQIAEVTSRKKRLRRNPLASLSGLISETARIYRKMKVGKLDHEKGRSLVWVLAQQRAMLEAEALERIEGRLDELGSYADQRRDRHNELGGRQPLRLTSHYVGDGLKDG